MILHILDERGQPQTIRARRALIMANDDQTPLGVALEYAPGVVFVSHAGEENFQRVLDVLGTKRTVHVQRFHPQSFDDIVGG